MLCEDPTLGQSLKGITSLISTTTPGSSQYTFLQGIQKKYETLATETDTARKTSLTQEINQTIASYTQGNVVQVSKDTVGKTVVAVPYAFLTPLNVIFNWSLQNLSSYYTDI